MENPYYNLNPISDPTMFIGRTDLLSRVFSAITHKQCISLVGSPRIGKSSVLMQIQRSESQQQFNYSASRHVLVYVDFQRLRQKTCKYFFTQVSTNLIDACKRLLEVRFATEDGDDKFVYILDQFEKQEIHPVLLMDNFDDIVKNKEFDSDFFAFLRSLASIKLVTYVAASLRPLSDLSPLYEQESSPFFNIFERRKVGPLTLDEAQTLIMLSSQHGGCPFTEEEVKHVLKLSGRHPFFIQRVCFFHFEEKSSHDITQLDWDYIQRQAYDDLSTHFTQIWKSFLDVKQQELLREKAQQEDIK